MNRTVIIGSRGSDLALWQANHVQQQLKNEGIRSEIKIIKTQGDIIQHLSFDKMEGKGFFTKEIEAALLDGSIDLAVHSHKDLETTSPPGLEVVAVSDREDPAELLIMHPEAFDPALPLNLKANAITGTSAARRKGQLAMWRNDLQIKDLRGNVPTRIEKLRRGDYDAILLAGAGVSRLKISLDDFVVIPLDPREFIPAPAQGVLALQIRENDPELKKALRALNNEEVASQINRERGVLRMLKGGCQVPFGALCLPGDEETAYWAFLAGRDGSKPRRLYFSADTNEFEEGAVLQRLTGQQQLNVLITRQLDDYSRPVQMLRDAGCVVTGQSFIAVDPTPVDAPVWNSYDWLFFTSANAVKHFPGIADIPGHVKVAAIGKGTRDALNSAGITPYFTGLGHTADVALVFREELGSGKVLVAGAANGLKTIQKALNAGQYDELALYSTRETPHEAGGDYDVIAFTSPSNVRAFFAANKPGEHTRLVAIGAATAKEIASQGYHCTVAWESTTQALTDTILGLGLA